MMVDMFLHNVVVGGFSCSINSTNNYKLFSWYHNWIIGEHKTRNTVYILF